MKCVKCESNAVISMMRHNAGFCKEHFTEYFHRQVETAVKDHSMLKKTDRIMVCVSGGKDSLVLWHVLNLMGYDTVGMYVSLGIGEYSIRSKAKVNAFAEKQGLKAIIVDLDEEGCPIPLLAAKTKRNDCSVCGQVKRHYFNKTALDGGFTVAATGHNLDDETARMLGNVLRWDTKHLSKMSPVLPEEGETMKRKVKPLIRLTEKEVAAYAFLNGIDYIPDECPKSKGASSIKFKEVLNELESSIPGTKHFFYGEFFRAAADRFPYVSNEDSELKKCIKCGTESYLDMCSFCRLTEKLNG
ncbi:ATP-binding protein [Seleniivibrio woodruffii]|uniref:ATP-binding protein n=1 Tax=Seleniivibrio woodruffii TaxID=1078050 RepID=UPI00240A3D46|nr:ATP-binding protein [Seleniivibrio woodruffii]